MAGLLDFIKTPEGQGLLAAGFGAAAGARPGQPWNTLGRGGLAGLAGYANAQDQLTQQAENETQRKYREMQMKTLESQMAKQVAQDKWSAGLSDVLAPKPEEIDQFTGTTQMQAPSQEVVQKYLMDANSPFRDKMIERQLFPKVDEPFTLGEGQVRYGPGGKVVAQGPQKVQPKPSDVEMYEFAQMNDGYKGTFTQWLRDNKKSGASNTNVNVNATKPFINEFAGGMGKAMSDARTNAQGALSTISTVDRLNEALDSGVMAGPGTSFRQFGLQVGSMLGVAGKDAEEKLLNTRQAIQSLAQLELDAAQQMKGQGQITEAERSIIRRAASGDIDSMTAPELRLLGNVLDRTARSKIDAYNTQIDPLMSAPETRGIAPFLRVEPPQRRAGQTPSVVRQPQGGAGAPRFLGFEGSK